MKVYDKFKAGSGDTFADRMLRAVESEGEWKKLMVEIGKFGGDIAGYGNGRWIGGQ